MENGQIIERGTHDELIEIDGLYADLYQRQFYLPPEEQTTSSSFVSAD